jgi:hypothetical protein
MNKDNSTVDDFAFLRRIANADKVDPRDMDQLVEAIGRALQCCRVDESTVSDKERELNEDMMAFIHKVDQIIRKRSDDDAGALVILYRKRIATPTNLEALLRMMDADIRTGLVRCVANKLILNLSSMTSIYGLKMNDGSSYASSLVSCFSKSLEDDAKQDRQIPHITGCRCLHIAGRMLVTALKTVKEDPLKVLERIAPFDWKMILETSVLRPDNENISYELFYLLWNAAVTVLVLDRNNFSFLQKLGSCHALFRSCLRRLVALRSFPSSPGNMTTTLNDLHLLSRFHKKFSLLLGASSF